MDFKVIWSEAAVTDLSGICKYIARHDADAARRIGGGILSHTELLASFPFIGPAYPRKSSGTLREIVFRTYRIFYQVSEPEGIVEILHVRHGARDEPPGFASPPPPTDH